MRPFLVFIFTTLLSFSISAESTNSSPSQQYATTIVVLLAIVALILGIASIVKRLKIPAMGLKGGIKIVTQLPLGQKERILLLDVNGEQLLVGVTSHQINLIKKLDAPVHLDTQSDPKPIEKSSEKSSMD